MICRPTRPGARQPRVVFATQAAGPVKLCRDIDEVLADLAAQGIQSLLLEGGAGLHASAWDAGVVDYVQLYVAPVSIGAGGVPGSRARLRFDGAVPPPRRPAQAYPAY